MKKNLLSILILALLVVNLIMTSIMMISVLNQSNKTAKLVGKIAAAVDLELNTGTMGDDTAEEVSIKNTDVYVISEAMTIPLAAGEDGKDHYFIVTVSLSLNMKHKDYKTYGSAEAMEGKESLIKSEINSVISQYTLEYCKANQEALCQEILERLQDMYDSDFIFNVTFSDPLYS